MKYRARKSTPWLRAGSLLDIKERNTIAAVFLDELGNEHSFPQKGLHDWVESENVTDYQTKRWVPIAGETFYYVTSHGVFGQMKMPDSKELKDIWLATNNFFLERWQAEEAARRFREAILSVVQ